MQIHLAPPCSASPIVATLIGINLTLAQAIEVRNQLTVAIETTQEHLTGKHISNAGKIKE